DDRTTAATAENRHLAHGAAAGAGRPIWVVAPVPTAQRDTGPSAPLGHLLATRELDYVHVPGAKVPGAPGHGALVSVVRLRRRDRDGSVARGRQVDRPSVQRLGVVRLQ